MSDNKEASPAAAANPGRRSFLDTLLGLGVFAWIGSAAYPIIRYLTPLQESGGTGPIELSDAEAKDVKDDTFTIVRSGNTRVIVFRDDGNLKALNAKCTHEGCTVQYKADEGLIWCACHNGKFDVEGKTISGPPPRPLAKYPVTQDENGKIIVSLEEQA